MIGRRDATSTSSGMSGTMVPLSRSKSWMTTVSREYEEKRQRGGTEGDAAARSGWLPLHACRRQLRHLRRHRHRRSRRPVDSGEMRGPLSGVGAGTRVDDAVRGAREHVEGNLEILRPAAGSADRSPAMKGNRDESQTPGRTTHRTADAVADGRSEESRLTEPGEKETGIDVWRLRDAVVSHPEQPSRLARVLSEPHRERLDRQDHCQALTHAASGHRRDPRSAVARISPTIKRRVGRSGYDSTKRNTE